LIPSPRSSLVPAAETLTKGMATKWPPLAALVVAPMQVLQVQLEMMAGELILARLGMMAGMATPGMTSVQAVAMVAGGKPTVC
jgi:hypothetical protein